MTFLGDKYPSDFDMLPDFTLRFSFQPNSCILFKCNWFCHPAENTLIFLKLLFKYNRAIAYFIYDFEYLLNPQDIYCTNN